MNTASVSRKQTSFRLSETLLARLQEEARRHNRSLNNLVESVLMSFVSSHPNKTTLAAMKEAEVLKTAKPLKVSFSGAEIVAGKETEEIGHLEGFSGVKAGYGFAGGVTMNHAPYSKRLSWIVSAKEGTEVTVRVSAPRAGTAVQTISLTKGGCAK